MNRREFLKTATIASVGAVAAGRASAASAEGAKLALPPGEMFKGMSGAWAAMYTPYIPGDKSLQAPVNYEIIPKMVEYFVKKGLVGLYLTGSTGEGFLLSHEERARIYRTVVDAAKGRLKVIAHIGCFSTADAVRLAKAAADAGVDWVSSVAPVYFGQTFKAAYAHYEEISKATSLPFLVYSVGKKIVPDEALALMKLPNVHGMKYTGRDYYDHGTMCRKLEATGKPAIYFSGADEQALNGFATRRFSGCIGTTDNQIPGLFVKICELAAANDFAAAAAYQERVCRYIDVHMTSGNASLSKAAMRYIGLDCGYSRRPAGLPYTEAEWEAHAARLAALGDDVIRRDDARILGIV